MRSFLYTGFEGKIFNIISQYLQKNKTQMSWLLEEHEINKTKIVNIFKESLDVDTMHNIKL